MKITLYTDKEPTYLLCKVHDHSPGPVHKAFLRVNTFEQHDLR